MFFREFSNLNQSKSLQARPDGNAVTQDRSLCSKQEKYCERASRCISVNRRGSMTVEAAFVFPLFLLGVVAFLYLFFLVQLRVQVGRALTDAGKEIARKAYFAAGEDQLADSMRSGIYGKLSVGGYLKGRASTWILKGGSTGVSLSGSEVEQDTSILWLRASYEVQLPPGISWFHPVRVTQMRVVRCWVGFGDRQQLADNKGEELVYITDYGIVYHRDLSCRHLKLSIVQEPLSEIGDLRNEDGAKYYPCERCWKGNGQMAYITESGNRYHESLNCSGLVRGIHAVPISQAGGLPPCSVCGW